MHTIPSRSTDAVSVSRNYASSNKSDATCGWAPYLLVEQNRISSFPLDANPIFYSPDVWVET
eukprot:COSAG02_NODE_68_length_42582_cov_52.351129_10_plen_62_part_00